MSSFIAFEQALFALPSKLCSTKPIRGPYVNVADRLEEVARSGLKAPLVLFLPGSGNRRQEDVMADMLVEGLGVILISPNTHARPDRPHYTSPADPKIYAAVHAMRRQEVSVAMERIATMPFVDKRFIVLAGLSEGAVAAASWPGSGITARIAISWNCEPSYFVNDVEIAGDPEESPFLNLNGHQDPYFGPNPTITQTYSPVGHGAAALQRFKRAKVIIYPHLGHRLLDHQEVRDDVIHFIAQWRDRFLAEHPV